MHELLVIDWDWNFVVEIEDGIVVKSFFTEKNYEESIHSDFAETLKRRLERYFEGFPEEFKDLRVCYPTEFSKKVLEKVREIPFGRVERYSSIAEALKTSSRAVGVALRMNSVPVIVPCHRVVSKAGIGGYSQGIEIKRALLALESKFHRKH